MKFRDTPIPRKLTWVIMLTTTAVLVLTGAAFMIYELATFKPRTLENVRSIAEILAANSSGALAFQDPKDAGEVISTVKAHRSVVEAALYDEQGKLFVRYPTDRPPETFPQAPVRKTGAEFKDGHLMVVEPVIYEGHLKGTLYMKSSLAAAYDRIWLYFSTVLMILAGSSLAAYALSSFLQKRISQPILDLARVARDVSGRKDYSVRASKTGEDELGFLTDSFNEMLAQIQQAQEQIRTLNADLENRVRERTLELTEANRELEAFTYSVAHDLRAPLRHIAAFAQILEEEVGSRLPDEASDLTKRIRSSVHHMARLVDDLLNLARIGRQELRRQKAELKPIVNEVIASFQSELQNRDIEFRVGKLPESECDPALMYHVFTNLISNAIKYTRPRGKAVIEIDQTSNNGKPAVFVRDNGVGFSMQYADKLFGVFQRLHRADEFEGTGVGLAIVERIIRKHGGKIWAEAEADKGATFYFTLE